MQKEFKMAALRPCWISEWAENWKRTATKNYQYHKNNAKNSIYNLGMIYKVKNRILQQFESNINNKNMKIVNISYYSQQTV